jgi:hypothetical protein
MDPTFLYSTNVWLKHHIAERFLGDQHRFWCSETFGGSGSGSFPGTHAPSSTPREIFLDLKKAIRGKDRGSLKIKQQSAMLRALAVKLYRDDPAKFTGDVKNEIHFLVRLATFEEWRPIVSVIPWDAAKGKVEIVDPRRRANPLVPEYIVTRVTPLEFGVIDVRGS